MPVLPDTPGLVEASPWSSREATSAEAVPESLVVVGGGVVGVEMANAYADLGARVTLLSRGGLLSGAEPFAGEMVADALRELGVDVRTGVEADSVERPGAGIEGGEPGPATVTPSRIRTRADDQVEAEAEESDRGNAGPATGRGRSHDGPAVGVQARRE